MASRDRTDLLTRRSLLVSASVLGGTAALGSMMGGRPAFAQSPTPGGNARVALSAFNPKSTLDPAIATSDFDLIAGGLLYDNLVKLDTSFAPAAGARRMCGRPMRPARSGPSSCATA